MKAKCSICGKEIETKEAKICHSCKGFLEWKYGNLENYERNHRGSI